MEEAFKISVDRGETGRQAKRRYSYGVAGFCLVQLVYLYVYLLMN